MPSVSLSSWFRGIGAEQGQEIYHLSVKSLGNSPGSCRVWRKEEKVIGSWCSGCGAGVGGLPSSWLSEVAHYYLSLGLLVGFLQMAALCPDAGGWTVCLLVEENGP